MKRRRVVVKIGSSSLTDESGKLSVEKVQRIVNQIADVHEQSGMELILVSSGAVACGLGRLNWTRQTITMPEKQAAAAVGQGLLMDTYERLFAKREIVIGQVLLTRLDVEDRSRFVHIQNTFGALLHHRVVPIVNENDTVAVDEIRFGDNDTLASLVALVSDADMLILLTDIDGFYTADPRKDKHAERIPDVWEISEQLEQAAGQPGSGLGTGGMQTKVMAAKIAVDSGVDVVVAASDEPDCIRRILAGESIGTTFHAKSASKRAKKSWILYSTRTDGKIGMDNGATDALVGHGGSLLLPGVTFVEGDFLKGAVVDLVAAGGKSIGRGVVNYSAYNLRTLLSRRESGEKLSAEKEVVHRDQLAITCDFSKPSGSDMSWRTTKNSVNN